MSDDKIVLDQIHGEFIEQAWPLLEPYFALAFRRAPTDLTTETIRQQAHETRMQLWAIYERDRPLPLLCAAATGIRPRGDERLCEFYAFAGRDLKTWMRPMLNRFERMARGQDVQWLRLEGRPGWARFLPDFTVVSLTNGRIAMEKRIAP